MSRPSHYRVSPREGLTKRQQEVLALLAKGYTNAQVAEALGITLDGAKFHVSEILARLDVRTREEAVAAWRAEQRPVARMRRTLAGLATAKVLVGGVAAAGAVVLGVGMLLTLSNLGGDDADAERGAVTPEDVLAAMVKPGHAVYIEMEAHGPDGPGSLSRSWYASDLQATRSESDQSGQPFETAVTVPGRRVSLSLGGRVLDEPLSPADTALPRLLFQPFAHIGALFSAGEVAYSGEETLDGQPVVRFDAKIEHKPDELNEMPVDTITRITVYLRAADLLPVRVVLVVDWPGQPSVQLRMDVVRAEYIPLAALPPGFFDVDALSDEPMRVLQAGQSFTTFWLGPRIDVPWEDPSGNGSDYQELVQIVAPGLPQAPNDSVVLGYGSSRLPSLSLLRLSQVPADSLRPSSEVTPGLMGDARAVRELPGGEGYIYVQYFPREGCTSEQAQREEDCRQLRTGRYGAVLEREGTQVHIVAEVMTVQDDTHDTNPFSSFEAMEGLVAMLRPIS